MTGRSHTATHPVTLGDVTEAAGALRDVVFRTPLLENADVNAVLGGRLLIKAESMQRTGAFKIRGAYNCIRQLTGAEGRVARLPIPRATTRWVWRWQRGS